MNDDDTYYETLGVEPDATRDELRTAYRSRVEELEAARTAKNFSDSALQANREETKRVRAAWNVLSDPFQRQRYDETVLAAPEVPELVDDDAGSTTAPGKEVQLTGWRKLFAPPPPKQPRPTSESSNGAATDKAPTRPVRQPTIETPRGTTLADGRSRGMSLLFDVSVLLVVFIGIQLVLPGLLQSDYKTTTDAITACNNVHNGESGKDLTNDLKKCFSGVSTPTGKKAQQSAAQTRSDKLNNHIKTTNWVTLLAVFIVWLLYLVPITARTGRTFGMRSRKLKVIKVDGSPINWSATFVRFIVPLGLALVLYPVLGQLSLVLGLALVLWGYRDPNKQGIHDKLAKTIVVQETA
jgi:hypothetical protein